MPADGDPAVPYRGRMPGILEETVLPLLTEDAINLLTGHAIGGPGWPDDGLSIQENRELYDLRLDDGLPEKIIAEHIARITQLVVTGVSRRFDSVCVCLPAGRAPVRLPRG